MALHGHSRAQKRVIKTAGKRGSVNRGKVRSAARKAIKGRTAGIRSTRKQV